MLSIFLCVALLGICIFVPCLSGCSKRPQAGSNTSANHQTQPDSLVCRFYRYKVLNSYPHDSLAFTQGLVFEDGFLYESTGLYGRSTVRKVELETGKAMKLHKLPNNYFGEGLTIFRDKIIQLTWESRVGFVYDKNTFRLLSQFSYPTQGWGITHDGSRLIMSDGTSVLHFLDTETFKQIGQLEVFDADGPVNNINELEFVKGQIYANIWPTDRIAIISPQTGRVTGWVNLTGLFRPTGLGASAMVPNGIAYAPQADRLFVTGKLWPTVFEIELIPKPAK
jgi:glutamine cyclotransferase